MNKLLSSRYNIDTNSAVTTVNGKIDDRTNTAPLW